MAGTGYRLDGLDEMEKRLSEAIAHQYPEAFREMVIDIAIQLEGKVKERTPVQTGRLRNAWRVGEIRRSGDAYIIEVSNNLEYAEAVEYGHRQEAGRYVPALGKRLKKSFIPGAHMLELSLAEVNARLPGYLREWLSDFLNTHEIV